MSIVTKDNNITAKKMKEFKEIPIGTVFYGLSGYIPHGLYLKVSGDTIYNFKTESWSHCSTDIFYEYREQEAMLIVEDKK